MGDQYYCENERRREAVREHATLNGIDYLEVLDQDAPPDSPRQQTLLVHCLKPIATSLGSGNVSIEGGVRVTAIEAQWVFQASAFSQDQVDVGLINSDELTFFTSLSDPDSVLVIRTDVTGDLSSYKLSLVQSPTNSDPPADFDPILSTVEFSFKADCPSEFDCKVDTECTSEEDVSPQIDYLARDYASFRTLMLDRLSTTMPDWEDRNPADLGIALVEVLAYAADHLSYYQDAAATEAYLDTARRRVSVRRHARLLDYAMHDGCNARTWVAFTAGTDADGVTLSETDSSTGTPTRLLTRCSGSTTIDETDLEEILEQYDTEVFELMHDVTLHQAHDQISFHTWSDEGCCLPKGATSATLQDSDDDPLQLEEGDVLIFEELLSPETGLADDRDLQHRQAVRLTLVETGRDTLYDQPIVGIEWASDDALSFPLCISAVVEGDTLSDISVAVGNVALADHGRTLDEESLDDVPDTGRYRPRLEEDEVTFATEYDDAYARGESASTAMEQDAREAVPAVSVEGGGDSWSPLRDLLASDRFAAEFVVEMEEDGRASLRFGDDVLGKSPAAGTSLAATYRVGNGTAGNVGAEAIAHVVTSAGSVGAVRNPLAAQGGTDPESVAEVRLYAPQAFRTQERAVTQDDYAEVAERHSGVQKAVATRRWTGSWHTMFVTVDRTGGSSVDEDFESELRDFLEKYRMAGYDLEIDGPSWVSLDIAMTVCVESGYLQSDVKEALMETFSSRVLSDRRRGYFHPDNFTFGQAVYLSPIVAAAMEIPGVLWVDTDDTEPKSNRFRRWGEESHGELEAGVIEIGRLEIARIDNDANMPENGMIEFFMEGGE